MNIGKVAHSPPAKKTDLPPVTEACPKPPADQELYTPEEVAAMNAQERQWIYTCPFMCHQPAEDLIDYEEEESVCSPSDDPHPKKQGNVGNGLTDSFKQMHVDPEKSFAHSGFSTARQDSRGKTEFKPDLGTGCQHPNPHTSHAYAGFRGARAPEPVLYHETDVSKVLRSWPDKDSPKFAGGVGISAAEWLRTMSVLLADRQAHPGIWHITAGQRLKGKAFRDWTDATVEGTRPTNWEGFKAWLAKMCPLGVTPDIVAAEFDWLKQEPNKACQLFYKRFCEWQVCAKATGFGHDERTTFVKRLTPGLSRKVNDAMVIEEVSQQPMTMQQVFWTACAHNCTYRTAQAAPVASSSKRPAKGDGGGARKKKLKWPCHNCGKKGHSSRQCPKPKTKEQKAWEKANTAKSKESKKE
ncbi:hypothetical protein PCASD_17020 [Puccinia coronata f. sp. avenae]|uniref:CCHC-type domain-containing protein n=1 Tax=Puccinia coronata f. sp. avenae TaxID=200324 RepID=A0A2N5SPV8_9BASI|nr:hypothetical protein PCASD_17020 [Puccinia coronata f. sp. avenae]